MSCLCAAGNIAAPGNLPRRWISSRNSATIRRSTTCWCYLQNPLATYFATASHWHKAFRRTIKDEARGLVILAPRTPVLMVYDIADTEGPPLPDKLQVFTQTSGPFNPMILDRTLKNAERDRILIERKDDGAVARGLRHGAGAGAALENARRPAPGTGAGGGLLRALP